MAAVKWNKAELIAFLEACQNVDLLRQLVQTASARLLDLKMAKEDDGRHLTRPQVVQTA
jgi:hypothetical protein